MISIVIPVYNEENSVLQILNEVRNEFDGSLAYEIIVVNDGSTDRTLDRLREFKMANYSIISHIENLGYGKSLFDGIVKSKYDCIAIIDGDGSYSAKDIKLLYDYHEQYDMVVGARSGREYRKGIFKKPARVMFNFLAEYAAGRKIADINSGLRIFRKDVILKYQDDLCTGFSFTTTITLIFMLNHYFVKYIPIEYHKREGKSKISHVKDMLRAAQIIIQAILHYNPIKLFLLIACVNAVGGVVIGTFNYFVTKVDFISILSGICVGSFAPIFCLGLIADQYKKICNKLK